MGKFSPAISIITPAHNSAQYIEDTIRSVISQTFESWEMIIVDDASSDNTVEIVCDWARTDPRIKLLKNEQNLGPGPSRNRALEVAAGRYMAFLDSDDMWMPKKLESQINFIHKTGAPMIFSSYGIMNEFGKDLGQIVKAPSSINYNTLLSNTVIGCLTVLIDTEQVKTPRMPSIPSRQPLVLWLRILREFGDAKGLDEVLAWYRVRPSSISSNKAAAAKQVWKVYREYENLGLFRSSFHFFLYAVNGYMRNIISIGSRSKKLR